MQKYGIRFIHTSHGPQKHLHQLSPPYTPRDEKFRVYQAVLLGLDPIPDCPLGGYCCHSSGSKLRLSKCRPQWSFDECKASRSLLLEIRDVGNYDTELTKKVFQEAIASADQPEIYCIWPPNVDAKTWMRELHQVHNATILQMIQLPEPEDWEYIAAVTAIDPFQHGTTGADMVVEALKEKKITNGKAVVLGYPEDYKKGAVVYESFQERLGNISSVQVADVRFLPWGSQGAYEAVLQMADTFERHEIHAIFAMDDNIMSGAYQALEDMGVQGGQDVVLVGSVCNGARRLLEKGIQYSTSFIAPQIEGKLAISAAAEFLQEGRFHKALRLSPVPAIKSDTWETMFVEIEGESYLVDDLCMWTIEYKQTAGITELGVIQDVCRFIDCSHIDNGLFVLGYCLAGMIYLLAMISTVLLFIYRDKKVVQLAQPFFLGLVIFGSVIDTTSIIFMSRDGYNFTKDQLNAACVAWPWLLSIGHMTTTATLVAKIYRVKKVCIGSDGTKTLRHTKVTVSEVSHFIVCFLIFDLVVLSIWYAVDPLQWSLHKSSEDSSQFITEAYGSCSSSELDNSWIFPATLLAGHFSALIYANVLVYQTRHVHKISDSKPVAVTLINAIELMAIGVPILILLDDSVTVSYLIRIFMVFFNNLWVLSLVVVPKLFQCIRGQGDKLPTNLVNNRNMNSKSFVSKELGFAIGSNNSNGSSTLPSSPFANGSP